MNQYIYKSLFLTLFAVSIIQAQVFKDKKELSFNVSENALLEIDAANTDIIIQTWNKNTVAIEAIIEVNGLTEKKAKSIIKNWEFEALGNKNKVQITSKSDDRVFFGEEAFEFNFNTFDCPEIDIDLEALSKIEFSSIDIPELNFENLKIPEFPDLKMFENFNFTNYQNDSSYVIEWKERVREGMDILQNSEWKVQVDSLRNSMEFKHEIERAKHEIQRVFSDKQAFRETLAEAQIQANKALVEFKKNWNERKSDSLYKSIREAENHQLKKRKKSVHSVVKKQLKIKVPTSMIFKLNIRHGKVELPEGAKKVSAIISYGELISKGLGEGRHQISVNNGPVQIASINSGSINLKNVPYAWFGRFSNARLFVNSGEVVIDTIGENTSLNQKFGKLSIHYLTKNFNRLNIVMDYAKGDFSFEDTPMSFIISNKESMINKPLSFIYNQSNRNSGVLVDCGFQQDEKNTNKLILTGIYSTVNIN